MRFLVLGCNGMAGHIISAYLSEQGHNVLGFDRRESAIVKSIAGDAMNTDSLFKIVKEGKFDSIINCIGLLNQFAENNKPAAVFLNSYLPHYLADITADTQTQVIHMSTDCVFSGDCGGYTEDSLRDGRTFYDRSKALGELEDNKNITLRNSIIGPDINPAGIGLFNWFMNQTASGKTTLNGYTGALWTGQTTLQLAKTMEVAAREKAHGLYNTVPDHSISKYELLKLFNKYFRSGENEINAVEGVSADKSLVRTRFDFGCLIPDYEVMIADMKQWVDNHKDWYKHYCLR